MKTFFGESIQDFNVKIYSNAELLKQPWWEEKCPPMSVAPDRRGATMTLQELFSQPKTYEETPFNPKYRIMLLNEPEFFRYTKNIEL